MSGKRGFQNLSPERVRELARLGGIAAHKAGHGHQFTAEEARAAALKGVEARRAKAAKLT